jgi:hypothetical protein
MRLRVGTESINFGVRRAVLAAGGTLLLAGFVGAMPAAAAGLPRSPAHLGSSAKALKIKPRSIVLIGDGTGLLAGPNAKGRNGIGWTSWTATSAAGTGSEQVDNCEPSCADGTFTGYPVNIEQWRPRSLGGEMVFTRMTIWFTGARPKGDPAHFTFTNLLADKTFGWSPPSPSGYCVGTEGQKTGTGCADVGALPPGAS